MGIMVIRSLELHRFLKLLSACGVGLSLMLSHVQAANFGELDHDWPKTCSYSTYSVNVQTGAYGLPKNYLSYQVQALLRLVDANGNMALVPDVGKADVNLEFFVNPSPLYSIQHTRFFALEGAIASAENSRVLDSPWLRLTQTFNNRKCKIIAVFHFDLRQMVIDQALLDGVKLDEPIDEATINNTAIGDLKKFLPEQYEQSVINLGDYDAALADQNIDKQEFENKLRPNDLDSEFARQEVIKKYVAKHFVPELFWFLSHSVTTKDEADGGFEMEHRLLLHNFREFGTAALLKLSASLANAFLNASIAEQRYKTLLDVPNSSEFKWSVEPRFNQRKRVK
jgi:hypothetical protein